MSLSEQQIGETVGRIISRILDKSITDSDRMLAVVRDEYPEGDEHQHIAMLGLVLQVMKDASA